MIQLGLKSIIALLSILAISYGIGFFIAFHKKGE